MPVQKFDPSSLPEVFRSERSTSAAIRRAVSRGDVSELGHRLYTTSTQQPPGEVIRRNLWRIVALTVPGAVIVDKTAFSVRPDQDGAVCVAAGSNRRMIQLPGLTIRVRPGGPVEGDTPFLGLQLSSDARAVLDNLRTSRPRAGFRWTAPADEVERRLELILDRRGERELNGLRDQARRLARTLNLGRQFDRLDETVGALLGTRQTQLTSETATARAAGVPFDDAAIRRLDLLAAELQGDVQPLRPSTPSSSSAEFSFWESYFSNYIEGTRFSTDVAHQIVFENLVIDDRSEDAHDIMGTFELANRQDLRARVPATADELEQILSSDHRALMAARPDKHPGEYKVEPNQAGSTLFVAPSMVRGTLIRGMDVVRSARPGLARAILMMFLISEVHPFDDGNGRAARLRMNAELSAAGEQRIIIPTGYRSDYLGALRRLSRANDPAVLIRALDRAQQFTAEVEWDRPRSGLEQRLEQLNAFQEEEGRPLRLPSEQPPDESASRRP